MEECINRSKKIILCVSIVTFVLAGCTPFPLPLSRAKYPTSMNQMQASIREGITIDKRYSSRSHVPRSVSQAMVPSYNNIRSRTESNGRRFDVAADRMPAKTFFAGLVDGTNYNMLVDPNIEGTVTLNLKNVTLEEVMAAVEDLYGYDFKRTPYGFEVIPPEIETQIFNVNYLDVKRSGKSVTEMISGQVTDTVGTINVGSGGSTGSTGMPGSGGSQGPSLAVDAGTPTEVSNSNVNTTSEMNFWKDLEKTLRQMVPTDKGRSVVVNAQGSVVIIRAFPHELHQVGRYLDRIQSNLHRQIIIEAKILEVQLNDQYEAGIDWSLFGNPLNADALISQTANGPITNGNRGQGAFAATGLQNFDPIFTLNYKGSFRTLVNFLQTQGNVQTLSSPHISTVNNQKAVIKVGQDEFFVTGVSTTNTVVGTNTLPSQNVSLTPFFSGITLDVTPQISKTGSVILHIHPSVSKVTEQQKTINLGSGGAPGASPNILTLPLALSTIRESDNIVQAHSGQIVVIGGLMQNTNIEDIGGTPGLTRIPFIGAAFRRTSQAASKSELIILLRPVVATNQVWTNSLKQADRNITRVKREFHLGGLIDDFGDRGEMTDT